MNTDELFRRGFLANAGAARSGRNFEQLPELRRWHPEAVPAFPTGGPLNSDRNGALAIHFSGARSVDKPSVKVTIGTCPWLFRTDVIDVLELEPGVWPVLVAQTRVGPNAGAVRIEQGHVTQLEFKITFWGPPSGHFKRGATITLASRVGDLS